MLQKRVEGATCNGISTGAMWSAQEMKYHIIILDLLAVKLSIQTFTKCRDVKAIPVQVGDIAALTYLMKMGGYSKSENGMVGQGNIGNIF